MGPTGMGQGLVAGGLAGFADSTVTQWLRMAHTGIQGDMCTFDWLDVRVNSGAWAVGGAAGGMFGGAFVSSSTRPLVQKAVISGTGATLGEGLTAAANYAFNDPGNPLHPEGSCAY